MTINLEPFAGKEVEVTFRNGVIWKAAPLVLRKIGDTYPYVLDGLISYTKNGEVLFPFKEHVADIVSIKLATETSTQTKPMTIQITQRIRIQPHPYDYWYTAEDYHLDVGCDGFTLSVWSRPDKVSRDEHRDNHICMTEEEALAVADAIYKFFKKQ
jgi:hypothetical protein